MLLIRTGNSSTRGRSPSGKAMKVTFGFRVAVLRSCSPRENVFDALGRKLAEQERRRDRRLRRNARSAHPQNESSSCLRKRRGALRLLAAAKAVSRSRNVK